MPDADVAPTGAGPSEPHLEAVQSWLGSRGVAADAARLSVFVRNYRCTAMQTPGLRIEGERRLTPPRRAEILRFTQATLHDEQGKDAPRAESRAVRIAVYETRGMAEAQSFAVELLTGFHSLPDSPPPPRGIGDLDLILPGDRIGLFARGNLVVMLSALGPAAPPISELARRVDDFLTRPVSAAPDEASARAVASKIHDEDTMVRYLSQGPRMQMHFMAARAGATAGPLDTATEARETPPQVAVYDEAQGNWVATDGGGAAPPETGPPVPPTAPAKPRRRS